LPMTDTERDCLARLWQACATYRPAERERAYFDYGRLWETQDYLFAAVMRGAQQKDGCQ
jgi:hypothetical protein